MRDRLDKIIEKHLAVLIGDANGADKAVQSYLSKKGYENVEVFCMEGVCRNNIGDWTARFIPAPKNARGREFYSIKDAEMTNESSIGLMLWDGSSKGTLTNISRLVGQGKMAVVYIAPAKHFETVRDQDDLSEFVIRWGRNLWKDSKEFDRDVRTFHS